MTLPRPHDDVVSQRVGEDLVLVHLKTNEIFALNETGARFWDLLVANRSREEIEEAMLSEYDVSQEELIAEIDQILIDLVRQDMLRAA